MIEFTKEEIMLLKALTDSLVAMTELEPDESDAVNKLYSFFEEKSMEDNKKLNKEVSYN